MNALPRRTSPRLLALLTGALLAVAACGGGEGPGDATPESFSPTSTTLATGAGGQPGTVGVGPFCASISALQGLGAGGAAAASPEQVLAQNEAMLDLLDDASATVPPGAPADVESLFDDYRRIAVAIGSAGGDVEAAYTALQRDEPELAARLFNETAHLPAFEYFANRCGIQPG